MRTRPGRRSRRFDLRERLTARVLLFDVDGRILLMKGRLPNRPARTSSWFTVGGGVEPGESLAEAARREVFEETGFADLDLGPVVWLREGVGELASGEPVIFKESYFVARCSGGDPSRAGWEAHEVGLIDDIRWWALDELAGLRERIFPEGFRTLIAPIAAGRYPAAPMVITAAVRARRG